MKSRFFFLAAAVLLVVLAPTLVGAEPGSPAVADPWFQGNQITIDWNPSVQDNPAVAFSTKHNQYLVVWESSEHSGDIYARFVDAADGSLLGSPIFIAANAEVEENPDVSYDPYNDQFVVVWQETGTTRSILALVLYGEYKQSTPQFPDAYDVEITSGSEDAYNPAIAHNADEHTFMIVFEVESVGIKGRIAEIDPSEPGDLAVSPDPSFLVRDTSISVDVLNPDVTWSGEQSVYFAVWQDVLTGDIHNIVGASLYDTYQSSGSQVIDTAMVGQAPSDYYGCRDPSVAYVPGNEYFVTVFTHKTGSAADASRELRAGITRAGDPADLYTDEKFLEVEAWLNDVIIDHHSPQIIYSGVSDWLYVTYITRSEHFISGDDYDSVRMRSMWNIKDVGTRISDYMTITASTANQGLEAPAIAGTPDGRALITWREEFTGSGLNKAGFNNTTLSTSDWDIFAQRIIPPRVQLPVVMRR